jgi:hypothetical protein
MILIIQKHYCINLQGDWSEVEISNGNRTENRSTKRHKYKRNMWDVGENWLPFKKLFATSPLISDEFEIPLNRTRKIWRYFLIMMIQKDTL